MEQQRRKRTPPEDAGPIASFLKEEQGRRGISQRRAAEEIGVPKASFNDWQLGFKQPVPEALAKIARWAVPHSDDPEKDAAAVEGLYSRLMHMAGHLAPPPGALRDIPPQLRELPGFDQFLATLESLGDPRDRALVLRQAIDLGRALRESRGQSCVTLDPQGPQQGSNGKEAAKS